MFYPSNLRFDPPFETLREPDTTKLVEEKYVKPTQETPKKYVDLTMKNVKMKDIVIFKDDKNNKYPTFWMVNDIFVKSNEVGLIEQIDDLMWDDDTEQRKLMVNVSELMKDISLEIPYEQFSHDSGPKSPDYGPESPNYAPESPNYAPEEGKQSQGFRDYNPVELSNTPSNSPSFADWQKIQPKRGVISDDEDDVDYERGEGPKITTNLVRIYSKTGSLTDKSGRKYD